MYFSSLLDIQQFISILIDRIKGDPGKPAKSAKDIIYVIGM